ncbi:tetratricopeptide repeat protein [Burkholderia sp. MR1-5-21]
MSDPHTVNSSGNRAEMRAPSVHGTPAAATFDVAQLLKQAWQLHEAGLLAEAEVLYRHVLEMDPNHVDALRSLGVLAHSAKQYNAAVELLDRALNLDPSSPQIHVNLADVLAARRERVAAVPHYRTAIALRPTFVEAYERLGTALLAEEDFEAAVENYRQLVQVFPDSPTALHNLGVSLSSARRYDEALDTYRRLLEVKPDSPAAYTNIANSLLELGKCDEALDAATKAVELRADYHPAHVALGNVLFKLDRHEEAVDAYRKAIEIVPDDPTAYNNLGATLLALKKYDAAVDSYLQAIDRKADLFHTYDSVLFVLNYNQTRSIQDNFQIAKRYGQAVMANVQPFVHAAGSTTRRPLRVGFVSGDLRQHPVGIFIESVLANLDRTRIEPVAYSLSSGEDAVTARLKPSFTDWKSLLDRTPRESAELIHDDKIDILIDLSGHTAKTGLPTFAWKPAPVQATWLGFFATTGVPTMDYIIGDQYVLPADEEDHFVEKPWRLPDGYLCFTTPTDDVAVEALPMLANGFVTFGCFNKLSKMNDDVVAVWAKLLRAAPTARLMLKSHELNTDTARDATIRQFADHGIEPERLILQGQSSRADYFAQYNKIDVALDPFPYNGGTTTVEALWMGVPVVARHGDRFSAHMSEGILHHVGHPEWIADDDEAYIAKALELVSDPARLAEIRSGLRAELTASPLCDAPRFARKLEDAFEQMWQKHCSEAQADPEAYIAAQMEAAIECQCNERFDEAVRLYQSVLELQPNHADANENLGILAIQTGHPKQSLPFLKTAVEAKPKREDFWAVYIEALLLNSEFDAAERALKLGRKLGLALHGIDVDAKRQAMQAPENLDALADEFVPTLEALEQGGLYDDMSAVALQMTQVLPRHAFGWKALAIALIGQGRFIDARQTLETASALLPGDTELRDVCRWIDKRPPLAQRATPTSASERSLPNANATPQAAERAVTKPAREHAIVLPQLGELPMDRIVTFSDDLSWGISNPARFNELMAEARTLVTPGYYFGDNLFTWGRNNSLFEDAAFRTAWESNIRNGADRTIAWRRYILACSAYQCVQLEGDFVECGVYQGTGIKTVMDYLGGTRFPKTFWGYDTFDYNPVQGHQFDGQQAGFFEKVQGRFAGYTQVNLVKGLLPEAFSQGMPEKVAYLHLDLNNVEGEIAVLEALFDRVVSGGMIILDDYEWSGVYRPQKKGEDQWLSARNYRVFPLPTGQGLVIKR